MARTYGEILPDSFAAVFNAGDLLVGLEEAAAAGSSSQASAAPNSSTPPVRIFVDVGSGHGSIVRAAVEDGGFDRGIGIEKYREPQAVADAMLATLPPPTRARLAFHLTDFGDCDLAALVREAVAGVVAERPPPPSPSSSPLVLLTIFINNLAFPPGVSLRHGRQLAGIAQELAGEGVRTAVVSAVPLAALEEWKGGEGGSRGGPSPPPPRPPSTLTLAMTFNPAHDARVYTLT